ncbi:MAG: hypothetical protein ABIL18_04645 [candidate division WOR-3 bacterium]
MLLVVLLLTTWTMEVVTTNTSKHCPTVAVDSLGNPYILVSYDTLLTLFTKINGNWVCDTIETNLYEPNGFSYHPDLAIDCIGRLWCVYRIYDTKMYLIVARQDGFGWVKDTVDSGINIDFKWKSIATDKKNRPHITYDKWVDIDILPFYAYKDTLSWHIDTVVSTPPIFTLQYCCSIDCDSLDRPHIAWFYDSRLIHSYKETNAWNHEILDYPAEGMIWPTSICIKNTSPSIAYGNASTNYVKYAYYDNSLWNFDVVDTVDITELIGSPKALDKDSSGIPLLLYRNIVAHKINNLWNKEILPPLTPPLSKQYPGALRSGRHSTVHVSRLATNSDETYKEIHYIYGTVVGIEESEWLEVEGEGLKLMVLPNVVRDYAQIQYAIPERQLIRLDLYDIIGRKVKTIAQGCVEPGIYSYRFVSSDLSSGVYFLVLESERESRTRKLLIAR